MVQLGMLAASAAAPRGAHTGVSMALGLPEAKVKRCKSKL